ncbi:MAG: ABC transporter permease [Acidobacteria bacterium]|nr:ABC transporter permease [Acidobacteriota bacterium]
METLLQDLRYGLRTLYKNPGFAATAILVLALGIGANTAIFSIVNAVLLRPLPFPHPEELVQIWHTPPQSSFPGMKEFAVSAANYLHWAAQNHVFQQTSIYSWAGFNLTGKGEPQFIRARAVSAGFFSVLEARPLLGRLFSPDEDQPGRNRVVILNETFWRNQFGGDPKIVGQDIMLDGAAYRVVGVMPAKFQFPIASDASTAPTLWTPLAMTDRERAVRGEHHYAVIGRLARGVTAAQAQAEMDAISRRLEQQYPADDKGWGAEVKPLREEIVGDVRTPLLVLLGAVGLVLLIACANAANLVFARTLARRKEMAVRSALGASRARVIRQVMAETIVLSVLAGIVGLLIATIGLKLLVAFLATKLPRASQVEISAAVLGFTFAISIAAGILAGFAPAVRLSGVNLSESLKLGSRTSSGGSGTRTRNALVVSEVALSLMLLVGAGLMIRSLWMLHRVDPGIDPRNVVAMIPSISRTTFPEPQQEVAFYREVLDKIRGLPGVDSAGAIDSMPLEGNGSNQPFQIVGRPVQAMADQPEVNVRLISTDYLHAMRIPLIHGRDFDDHDSPDSPGAILISQSLAKKFWPNEDPIGQHVTMYFFPNRTREVVGIVGDVKDEGLGAKEAEPMIYMPLGQLEAGSTAAWRSFPLWIVARAKDEPTPLISSLRNVIHEVNPALPIADATRMEDFVDSSLSQQRFNMLLLAGFAGIALFLAAIGIYSVLAYNVRRRTREIGIRMALGAQTSNVISLIFAEAMRPTMLGVAIGVAGALALGRSVSSLIYGVKPTDLTTFSAVSLVLVAVSVVASLLPAYRATRVQPVRTLREE